jgi:rare lipoprotein A
MKQHYIKNLSKTILAAMLFIASGLISIGTNLSASIASAKGKYSRHEKREKGSVDKLQMSMAGTASWYGHGFHNRTTASGSRYDQNAYTGAHKTLPFGTVVRVTNVANNKSCLLTITDRGPYVKNRIIDVSKAAAKKLDFASIGTAQVRIQILGADLGSAFEMKAPIPARDMMQAPKLALR